MRVFKVNGLLFLLLLCLSVCFFGTSCTEKKTIDGNRNEIDIEYTNIVGVSIKDALDVETIGFNVDSFEWSNIFLQISYSETEFQEIPLTENMVKAESKLLVTRPGTYTIDGVYGKFNFSFKLKLYSDIENLFSVSFYDENGDRVIGSVRYLRDGDEVNPPVMPTKSGYTHVGWKIKNTDTIVTDFTVHNNVVYVAVFEPDYFNVEYFYILGEQTVFMTYAIIERGGDALAKAPDIPTFGGYSNGRWQDEEAMRNVGVGNTTFYIIYDVDKVLVTFSYYKYIEGVYYDYNVSWNVNSDFEGISPPDDVERITDNVFLYWYVLRDGKEIKVDFPYKVQCEMKFIAKYTTFSQGTENLLYRYDALSNTYTITGLRENSADETVVIPINHLGVPVTAIDDGAFKDFDIKRFSVNAFNTYFRSYNETLYNLSMSELIAYPKANSRNTFTIESSTQKIRAYAFYDADNLSNITMSKSIVEIGEFAFAECDNLSSMHLSDNVTILETGVFKNAKNISEITLGNFVTTVKDQAFYGDKFLERIDLPSSIVEIGNEVFAYCDELTGISIVSVASSTRQHFRIYNGALYGYNADRTNEYYYLYAFPAKFSGGTATEINLHKDVRVVKSGAFTDAIIAGINLPTLSAEETTVTFEEESVVCKGLVSMRFGTGTMDLHPNTFGSEKPDRLYKTALTTISENCGVFVVDYDGALLYREFLLDFSYMSIENDVVEITGYRGRSKTVIVPYKLGAFTVIGVGNRAFEGNEIIESVKISNGITYLGDAAFCGCKKLKTVELSDTVYKVGKQAFYNCAKDIRFDYDKAIITEYGEDGFGVNFSAITDSTGYAKVAGVLLEYSALDKSVVIPEDIVIIGMGAMKKATYIDHVDFSFAYLLREIQAYAFANCEEIVSVSFLTSLVEIDEYAFKNCVRLTTIDGIIGVNVAETAFEGVGTEHSEAYEIFDNTLLKYNGRNSVAVLPEGITEIGERAFAYNTSLEKVYLSDDITTIKGQAFYGCTNLNLVLFGSRLLNIEELAFANCNKLSAVDFSRCMDIEHIAYNSFDNTKWLLYYLDDSIIVHSIYYKYQGESSELHVLNSVKFINDRAFYENEKIEAIHFPESLEEIRKEAFKNSNIAKLDFSVKSQNMTIIGDSAFSGCHNFEFLDLSGLDHLTTIGKEAFAGISHQDLGDLNIYLSSSVSQIGESAFEGSNIKSVKFESGSRLEIIEKKVFAYCYGLGSVVFEGQSNLYKIDESAFENCNVLTLFSCPGGKLETIETKAFTGAESLSNFIINESKLLNVGAEAFSNNKFIVENEDTMVYLGKVLVKYNGILLDTVIIPADTNSIGNSAFRDNTFIKNVIFLTENGKTDLLEIQDYAFAGCSSLEKIIIPDSVNNIGKYSFANCSRLSEIVFGAGVETIGEKAFANCLLLESVILPSKLKKYEGGAFTGCSLLKSIVINDSSLFWSSDGVLYSYSTVVDANSTGKDLTLIAYPNGLTAPLRTFNVPERLVINGVIYYTNGIGNYAFSDIKEEQITTINICKGIHWIGKNAFENISATVNFEEGQELSVFSEKIFSGYLGINISIPDSVVEIGAYAFENAVNLTSLEIGPLVEKIGSYAFSGTTMEIVWAESIRLSILDDYAFVGYRGDSLVIPESVSTIGKYAFQGITSNLYIDAVLMEIGDYVFCGYKGSSPITINEGVISIGDYAFKDVTNLSETIVIPATTMNLGMYAFENVMVEIRFENGSAIEKIGDYAFAGYLGTSIILPESISEIGNYAFYACENLSVINFSKSVNLEKIRRYSFARTAIENLEIPDTITDIEDRAFSDCENLKSVSFGEHSKLNNLGSSVFALCDGIAEISIPNLDFDDADKYYLGYYFGAINYQANSNYLPIALRSVKVLKGTLRPNSFYNCFDIEKLYFTENVVVEEGSLVGCSNLKELTLSYSGVLGKLFGAEKYLSNTKYVPLSLTNLTLLQVTEIEDYAFFSCTNLRKITLPENLVKIGSYAFFNCSRLENMYLGEMINEIGTNAFARCSSMTEFTVNRNNSSFVDSDGVLYQYNSQEYLAKLVCYPQKKEGTKYEVRLVIDTDEYTVTEIAGYAFYYSELMEILMHEGIKKIGEYAFYASKITYARLFTNDIGLNAFKSCTRMNKVYIEDFSLAITPTNEFKLFDYAEVLYVPYDVEDNKIYNAINLDTYIGQTYEKVLVVDPEISAGYSQPVEVEEFGNFYAMYRYGKTQFRNFYVTMEQIQAGSITVNGQPYLSGNSYPLGTKLLLNATAADDYLFIGWFGTGSVISLDDTFEYTIDDRNIALTAEYLYLGTNIDKKTKWNVCAESQYPGNDSISYFILKTESLDFVDNNIMLLIGTGELTTNIKDVEYEGITLGNQITGIKFCEGITFIGEETFNNYNSLRNIGLATSITGVGDYAFAYDTNLANVNIANGIRTIGAFAFYECELITSVKISDAVISIGTRAFGRTQITNITLPASLRSIAGDTFYECLNLRDIDISGENEKYLSLNGVLYSYDEMTFTGSLVIYPTAKSDYYIMPFKISKNIKDYSVTKIGEFAFIGSTIESISIPSTVISINDFAFENCIYLNQIDFNGNPLFAFVDLILYRLNSEDNKAIVICNLSGENAPNEICLEDVIYTVE